MDDHQRRLLPSGQEDDGPIVLRRPVRESGDMDITPMIDVTFLLLIFFLVASVPDYQKAVRLPPARHGQGVGERTAVIFSVFGRDGGAGAEVYVGDGRTGSRLPDDPDAQQVAIVREVDRGLKQGKPNVLIKAEPGVRQRDVARVAAAAGRVEGITLHLAVKEVD